MTFLVLAIFLNYAFFIQKNLFTNNEEEGFQT